MVESNCLTTSVVQSCNRSIPRIIFSSGRFMTAVILFSITLLRLAALFLGMSAGSVFCARGKYVLGRVARLICNSRRSSLSPDKLHKICFLHDNLQFILDSCDDIINE